MTDESLPDDALKLIERFRAGDARAADELFHRYVSRLTALARSRLSAKLVRRVDPEDIVQSAYRSFFVRAQAGQFTFAENEDLWRLLVAMTMNKLRGQVEHHTAGKRSMSAEQSMQVVAGAPPVELDVLAREPSPEDALELVERVEGVMTGLTDVQRQMFEMRLQGYQIEEIAAEVGRSERGVRRLLDKIKERLNQQVTEQSHD